MPDCAEDGEDPATIYICQGPPVCDFEGDAAVDAQKAGCLWCRRDTLIGDQWVTEEPSRA